MRHMVGAGGGVQRQRHPAASEGQGEGATRTVHGVRSRGRLRVPDLGRRPQLEAVQKGRLNN